MRKSCAPALSLAAALVLAACATRIPVGTDFREATDALEHVVELRFVTNRKLIESGAAGIARSTYNDALGHFDPDPDVLKRAGAQPEFNTKIWNYLDQMVSDERLSEGKTAIAENSLWPSPNTS